MGEPSLLQLFVRPLEAAGIDYFVTGGVAAIVYGEPRFTRDIDLVLAIHPGHADRFLALWPEAEFYAPPRETFLVESARADYGHFNLVHIDTGLSAVCYVAGTSPLHAWAFSKAHRIDIESLAVRIAPVEYVIVQKLSYFQQSGSTRHLEDIARIRRIQGDAIAPAALQPWLSAMGLDEAWTRACALDPEQL